LLPPQDIPPSEHRGAGRAGALHVVLDLTRAEEAGDPHAFRFATQVYLLRSAGGGVETATFLWDDAILADLQALRAVRPDPAVIQRLGNRLRAFLKPAGWTTYEAQIREAAASDRRVIVTIRSNAAELYALPWELVTLEPSGEHLGRLEGVLIRYAWPRIAATPEAFSCHHEGGRILTAWSAAGGAVPASELIGAVKAAARGGEHPFDAAGDVLAHASFGRLSDALNDAASSEAKRVAVLHLLCHGGPVGQTFGLILDAERGAGEAVPVDADQLRALLAPHAGRVRLVVLSACDSANTGAAGNQLGSLAQAIHRAGVETVIASRFPLSARNAVAFSESFYGELLGRPASVEDAFLAARRALGRDPEGLDWAGLQLLSGLCGDGGDAGGDSRPIVIRPFRGLLAFKREHGRLLFGRDAEIEEILRDLDALIAAGKPRLLIVTGASGTGKSSVVLGGAIPRLLSRPEARWEVQSIRPGSGPIAALEAALAARKDTTRPLLLVVDQFEELFTQTEDPALREPFVRRLWALAGAPGSGVSVILTMRVDFIGRGGELALDDSHLRLDRVAYDEAHRVFLSQMGPRQIEEVIRRPTQLVGLTLEAGLCEEMIDDVGAEPGALPLLEDTLDLLWQRREGRALTHAAYRAVGGVVGALHGRADALVDGLEAAEKEATRALLVQLVSRGGEPVTDARRRVPIDALKPRDARAAARFERVASKLVSERLLVRDEQDRSATLEVAHEALIRTWRRLGQWVQDEREAQERARRKRLVGVAALAVFAAVLLAAGTIWALGRRDAALVAESEAKEAAGRALTAERKAEAQMQRALEASLLAGARELLASKRPELASMVLIAVPEPEHARGWSQLALDILGQSMVRSTLTQEDVIESASWSPDGARVLTISSEKKARIFRADGAGDPVVLEGDDYAAGSASWSSDATHVAIGSLVALARVFRADGTGEPVLLRGHDGAVHITSWSPDGTRIATGSDGPSARIFRADGTGEPVLLRGHDGAVRSLSWSPDGARVATGSDDQIARVFRANGALERKLLPGHDDAVTSVSFSRDGAHILTTSRDRTARVFRTEGSAEPMALSAAEDDIVTLASWSPDGKRILTLPGVSRTKVAVRSLVDPGGGMTFEGHEVAVSSASWSPDGEYVVTGAADGIARVFRADDPSARELLVGHEGPLASVSWSPDGDAILTRSAGSHALHVWRARGSGEPVLLDGHERAVHGLSWSPDGGRIVTVAWDSRVWNADGSGEPLRLPSERGIALSPSWSPDGRRIVTGSTDGKVRVWSADRPGNPQILEVDGMSIHSASWSPVGERIAVASENGRAYVFRTDDSGAPGVLSGHHGPVWSASWSPDGKRILTASSDQTARVWSADDLRERVVLEGRWGAVFAASYRPDGARILTLSHDRRARVWNADTGALLFEVPHEELRSAAWSPDGSKIVTASADRTARVWSADDTRALLVLEGHEGGVDAASWSPDGKRIATVSDDKTVRVWKADDAGEFLILRGHENGVETIAWSPDGSRIATGGKYRDSPAGSDDKTARIWHVTVPGLKEALRRATTDCLTSEQRGVYLLEATAAAQVEYAACERSHGRTAPALGSSVDRPPTPTR